MSVCLFVCPHLFSVLIYSFVCFLCLSLCLSMPSCVVCLLVCLVVCPSLSVHCCPSVLSVCLKIVSLFKNSQSFVYHLFVQKYQFMFSSYCLSLCLSIALINLLVCHLFVNFSIIRLIFYLFRSVKGCFSVAVELS